MGKAVAAATGPADELGDDIPDDLDDLALEDDLTGEEADPEDGESGDPEDDSTGETTPDEDDGEQLITFGDPPEPSDEDSARAPTWVRDLREANRQKDQRIRDLERQLTGGKPATPAGPGPKPKLEDFDHDEDKFAAALEAWHDRKRDAEAEEQRKTNSEREARAAWERHLATVDKAASDLKVGRADEARQAFEDELSPQQQAVVMHGPDDPKTAAMLRHALGANPAKLRELASINDPVKFAFAVFAKLVPQMKVTPKKQAPAPERAVTGSGRVGGGSVEKRLDALRVEAARTGDMSKVMAFKRKLKGLKKG